MATRTRGGTGANRTLLMLQDDWSAGSRQDKPRDQIPGNAAWLLTDCFPDADYEDGNTSGFPLRSRNGWVRSFAAMSATSSSYAVSVAYAPFVDAGHEAVGIDEDGRLYSWTLQGGGSSGPDTEPIANAGAAIVPTGQMVFYRETLYLLAYGATGKTYDGSSIAAMSGSPPQASVGCVYKDHLVVANDATTRERIWFSDAGDATGWNTAADGQWLDASRRVTGLATFQNSILVFEDGLTERIRGDIIPGVINSDMVREPLFPIGCTQPTSIAVGADYVVFANHTGIFLTDGQTAYDLTEQCGMKNFYYDALNVGYGVTITGALFKGWYVFAARVGGGPGSTSILSGAIHVRKKQFVKFTNVIPSMITSSGVTTNYSWHRERLLMAEASAPRVTDLGAMLELVSSYTDVDGDGTVIAPEVQTRFYRGNGRQPQRWRSLYLTGGGDVPAGTTTIKYSTSPHIAPATTLTAVHDLGDARTRVNIGKQAEGMSFSVTPAFESGETSTTGFHLDMLEAEVTPLYGRRR